MLLGGSRRWSLCAVLDTTESQRVYNTVLCACLIQTSDKKGQEKLRNPGSSCYCRTRRGQSEI